jgi:hypothetical protein
LVDKYKKIKYYRKWRNIMILRKIEFECINNDSKYAYELKKKAKYITNYINRNCLQNIKFVSNDFSIFVIYLMENMVEPYIVNNGLVVPVIFNKNEYDKINKQENYFKYFSKCIKKAFETINKKYELPEDDIIKTLEAFKENNYINTWIHKKKGIKNLKITISLNCEMTMEIFRLKLNITKEGKQLLNKTILETDPDEVAFEYRFKDIEIENNTIKITSKNGTELFKYEIE